MFWYTKFIFDKYNQKINNLNEFHIYKDSSPTCSLESDRKEPKQRTS